MEAWAARGIRGEKLGGLSARKCVAVRYASLSFSRRLRRRREKLVLQPARPPFLLASDGLVGLGCEGNVWFSARLCRLGPSRCRVWCPGGACKVEAARPQWNKVLQALFHLVVTCSGVGDKPVGWELFRSGDRVGASDLDDSCTGVPTGARTCSVLQPGLVQSAGCWLCGCVVGGFALLPRWLPATRADPEPGRHGVWPRLMSLHGVSVPILRVGFFFCGSF